MQFFRSIDIAVFTFLLFRRKHKLESVCFVKRERDRLVVDIDHQVTATSLVVRINEPMLDIVKMLTLNTVNAHTISRSESASTNA